MIRLDWAQADTIEKSRDSFAAHQPFPVFCVDDFVADPARLDRIQDELMEESFYEKCNDLYNFHQSEDLTATESRAVTELVQQLYGDEFRSALTAISGIPLNSNIDVTSSLYRRGDHLLPHDDQLLGRRIAFILYLVPEDWTEEDGGHLDLFQVDSACQPNAVGARLLPRRNRLAFFEVSPISFHQVAEVLSDKHRLSIHGWFHGAEMKPNRGPACSDSLSSDQLYNQHLRTTSFASGCDSPLTDSDLALLRGWVSPSYLSAKVQRQICTQFEAESEIELRDFLSASRWTDLESAVADSCSNWEIVGPFNKRRFQVLAPVAESADAFAQVCALFHSEAMGKLLHILSGGYYRIVSATTEVRRFEPGSYTLAFDGDPEAQKSSLDVTFSFTTVAEDVESGATVYVDENAEEPLCVITPKANSLTMVLRAEPGTMRFVKYLNAMSTARIDLDVSCSILEHDE